AEAQKGSRLPAVVFVLGYSDLGARAIFGCRFKEMESFISWGRLAAASGLVGITYSTGEGPGGRRPGLAALHPGECRDVGNRREKDRPLGLLGTCTQCL